MERRTLMLGLAAAALPAVAVASPGHSADALALLGMIMGLLFMAPFALLALVLRLRGVGMVSAFLAQNVVLVLTVYLLTDVDPPDSGWSAACVRSMVCMIAHVPVFAVAWWLGSSLDGATPYAKAFRIAAGTLGAAIAAVGLATVFYGLVLQSSASETATGIGESLLGGWLYALGLGWRRRHAR